ncbi:MAG TPA: shikimate kinase [Tepidisphaeraceae bacterium]|nr:shikimate kinase [Tepidisphaeraceae bacterium]
MNVALIGYRGCGKTTIGRRLADRLWEKFIDVDDQIVAKAGKSIKDIFAQDGEAHFRDLETQVLQDIAPLKDHVLGLGGGSIIREQNRQLLRAWADKIIYLKCDARILHRRIEKDPRSADMRPNLTQLGGGLAEIEAKLAEREALYREVKDIELDVSNLSEEEAVAYIGRFL